VRLDYIKLHNFFNHADTEIDFTEVVSPTLVTGSNGAGKTSAMVESLTYALFGETRLASIDDAIRNEEDEMSVTVQFHLNNQDVRITRSKKRGKSQKLKLSVNDIAVEELLSETQARIDKLIGLSSDTFRSSVLLRQDDSNFFVKAKPDARKQIIAEILNLSQFERLEKIAKEKRSTNKAEIKASQYVLATIEDVDISELKDQLARIAKILSKHGKKIESAQAELNEIWEWNAGVSEQVKRYKEVASNNELINRKIAKTQQDIETQKREYEECTAVISKFKDPAKVLKQATEALEDLQEKIANGKERLATVKAEMNSIVAEELRPIDIEIATLEQAMKSRDSELPKMRTKLSKMEALDVSECPTCLQELNKNKHQALLAEMKKDIERLEVLNVADKKKLAKLQEKRLYVKHGHSDSIKLLNSEGLGLNTDIGEWSSDLATVKSVYQAKIKAKEDYTQAKQREEFLVQKGDELGYNLDFLKTQIKSLPEVTLEAKDESDIKEKLAELRDQQKQAISAQVDIEQTIAKAEKDADKKQKLTEDIGRFKQELELLELLCVALSKNGIPASIIETVLPEIQETANFYLAKMSESTFELTFNTTATLKNGEERGTLDVQVFDGHVWRNFESLSGGEQFRVSLSIRLALSKVLSRRAGVELDLLILDEPASALDTEGREAFCSTIKSLSDSFSRILIMSHIPQLQEEFDSRINLSKSQAGTKVL